MEKTKNEIIPATFDPVFKEVFTSPDCHNFVCTLISLLTKIDLNFLKKHLKVINSNLPREKVNEKASETDVLLSVEGHIINIEMNKDYYEGLFIKNDLYQHKVISRVLKKGDTYIELKRVIQINIDNFSRFQKEISEFKLMEVETGEIENESYIKYHISLSKIREKYYNGGELSYLEKLLLMIGMDKKEELEEVSEGDEVMMELRKKVEILSDEEAFADLYDVERQERMIYNTKMKYAEDKGLEKGMAKGMEKGMKKGMAKGLKEGLEKGKKEGKKAGIIEGSELTKIDIAKNMLEENMDIKLIMKLTGLSNEEIKKISN